MTYQSQLTELKGMIEKIEYYKYTTDPPSGKGQNPFDPAPVCPELYCFL